MQTYHSKSSTMELVCLGHCSPSTSLGGYRPQYWSDWSHHHWYHNPWLLYQPVTFLTDVAMRIHRRANVIGHIVYNNLIYPIPLYPNAIVATNQTQFPDLNSLVQWKHTNPHKGGPCFHVFSMPYCNLCLGRGHSSLFAGPNGDLR